MTDESKTILTMPSDREIHLTRVFDAPRDLVWDAWTDPAHLAHWWGPVGFSNTTHAMALKPGGQWRFDMHGPDGRDYPNLITFLEVQPPERLVYKHGGDRDVEPVNFQVTVTLERVMDGGEKTRLSMRSLFPTPQARGCVIHQYGAAEGGKQHLARLAEYLASDAARAAGERGGSDEFTITRVVRAPRDLVYRVWTERDHLLQWFGPAGCTMPSCELDLRVGGRFLYCLRPAGGGELWARWIFREIVPGTRIVFVMSFSDAEGNVVKSPFGGEWPLETLSTVEFSDHAGIGHGTVVTIRAVPINAATAERDAFRNAHPSMQQGWGGTFGRLVAHVSPAGGSPAEGGTGKR